MDEETGEELTKTVWVDRDTGEEVEETPLSDAGGVSALRKRPTQEILGAGQRSQGEFRRRQVGEHRVVLREEMMRFV